MAACFDTFMDRIQKENMFLLDVQLRQGGEIVDHWSRFPAKPRFETYSASKTFASAAFGIAMEEGLLRMDDRLCDAFPEEAGSASGPYASEVTVRHMLTMTSGIEKSMLWRDGRERKYERDWVKWFFENANFSVRPGTAFLYNNANTYLLGCMLEKRSGQNIREFLRDRLFAPLGIGNPEWMDCPMGHTIGANGLAINADEVGRFGQLIADGGALDGRQIIPADYVREMLQPHAVTAEPIPGDPPYPAHYGYHIWLDDARRAAYLWGTFGQYCVILPEKNAVISVVGLQSDDGSSNGAFGASPLRKRIWEDLVEQL